MIVTTQMYDVYDVIHYCPSIHMIIANVNICNIISIFGGIFGIILFLMYLESPQMGNIIYRNGKFSPSNIFKIIINPLYKPLLWNYKLWMANWIIMMGSGIIIFRLLYMIMIYIIYQILKNILKRYKGTNNVLKIKIIYRM